MYATIHLKTKTNKFRQTFYSALFFYSLKIKGNIFESESDSSFFFATNVIYVAQKVKKIIYFESV